MKNRKYSWNLTDLYKSDNDPQMEKDFKETQNIEEAYALAKKLGKI